MTRRSRTGTVQPGLLVVDKPAGITSHDVVARVRRLLGLRRVGHAGTLDPMATGVLVLGIDRATRLLGHLALDDKEYLATIRLGVATSTDDADGDPVATADPAAVAAVTEPAIRAGMAELTGAIQQVPSAVSAVKIGGVRAYDRVRRGEQVELPARPVTVSRFDLLALRHEHTVDLDVAVECSSGTYVRALARDLGARLGAGGHLTALRRTRVGPFGLAEATSLDELTAGRAGPMSVDAAVGLAFPRRAVDQALATDLSYGRPVAAAGIDGTYGVFDPDGHAVALVAERGGKARPVLVLRPA